jgi:polar amino acid transport system substrate-binding protein
MRLTAVAAILALCLSWPVLAADKLTISTIERAPFSFPTEAGWGGFSIDLLEVVAERMDWELDFQRAESFPEMLAAVEAGTADLAVANISITSDREESLDFSQPIFDAGLAILVPESGQGEIFSVLFSWELMVWVGGAFLLLMLAGVVIWLIEAKPEDRGQPADNDYDDGKIGGPGEGIWWAVNVVTQAGFDIPSPKTRGGRFVAFGLILVGLFAVSAFVAQITAALTVNELNNQVSGYQDLYGKRVGTTEGSTSAQFLAKEALGHVSYESLEAMFAGLESNRLDALVHDAPILAYYAHNRGRGKFSLAGRVFREEKYGFAMQEEHWVREDLNRALLEIREDGTYKELVVKWFGENY